ncbi:MAG: ABC transporter permease, partial [Thermotoga sp.]
MKLWYFIMKRLFLMVIVLFGILVLVFFIAKIIPADPV